MLHGNIGKPWILAGGLTAENVAEAVKISGAAAVDVSGGVEISGGVKSREKIAAFYSSSKGRLKICLNEKQPEYSYARANR